MLLSLIIWCVLLLAFVFLAAPAEYRHFRRFRIITSQSAVTWLLYQWQQPVGSSYLPAIFVMAILGLLWASPVTHQLVGGASIFWEPFHEKPPVIPKPNHSESLDNAAALRALGHLVRCEEILAGILREDPCHPEACLEMADTRLAMQDPDSAIEILLRLKKATPSGNSERLELIHERILVCARMRKALDERKTREIIQQARARAAAASATGPGPRNGKNNEQEPPDSIRKH